MTKTDEPSRMPLIFLLRKPQGWGDRNSRHLDFLAKIYGYVRDVIKSYQV